MKNYMVLTNPEDIPGKGFIVSDKLERTFCKCGFIESGVFKECPICGNTDFVMPCGVSETYFKVEAGVLFLETKVTSYDVARNQQVKTRVTTRVRYNTNKFMHLQNGEAEKYFDDPITEQFASIRVAKYLYRKLPKMYNGWFTANRFCNAIENIYGTVSEELVDTICNEFGDKSLYQKIDYASSYSKSIKDIVSELKSMSLIDRMLCDCPQVFKDVLLVKRYSLKNINDNLKSLIYAYWSGNYIHMDACSRHLSIFSYLPITEQNIDAVIKYYKDNYVNITAGDVVTPKFVAWLASNPLGTFKDFNLYENLAVLDKQYGIKKVNVCTDSLYQNSAQFFIDLANQVC